MNEILDDKKRNRLEQETSPYLLQHASNPVDWFPWGDEALARAKRDQKPIFLSIGYSACHWCHVMERESFEDEETAKILNEHFISIKVDREERPDLDHIYMTAVQAMTQHGGWPLNVFLTPELQPFYGGTYFPKEDKHGMPNFKKILSGVSGAWKSKRDEIRKSAEELTAAIIDMQVGTPTGEFAPLSPTLFERAAEKILESFDADFGGLGNAPKFFHSTDFRFLLREWKETQAPHLLAAVDTTLSHWANGGIYDQLGGGFHRYSTDRIWLVPHFEKMLYDNALLVPLFLEAYQATKNPEWARVARETLDYLQREMEDPAGGFYATQDADSEGVEGKFFVWDRSEIKSHLDEQLFEIFSRVFDLPERGNWEDSIILQRRASLKDVAAALKLELPWVEDNLAVAKKKLLDIRSLRIAPQTDHKIVTSWNGLVLTAFARGYAVFGVDSYRHSAEKCAAFLLGNLAVYEDSKLIGLCHTYKDKFAKVPGFLEDYACLADGLLSLFGVTWELRWLEAATDLVAIMVKKFWDPVGLQFYFTSQEHTDILTRVRDSQDGATPSGTSMAFTTLIRFSQITGVETYHSIIEKGLGPVTPFLQGHPTAVSQLLCAAFEWHHPHTQWVTICSKGKVEEYHEKANQEALRFHPSLSRWVIEEGAASRLATKFPILSRKTLSEGDVRHFVCKDFSCLAPTEDDELAAKEAGIRD